MASQPSRAQDAAPVMLCGTCPDQHCQTKLYFPSYDVSIECPDCGQRHLRQSLKDIKEVKNPEVAIHNMLRTLLVGNVTPKKTTDSVKVLGLSNYHCKLLSPLLTRYGMDKQGKAVPLRSLNKGDVFNCAILGSRAFLIQPEHIEIMGYGRDMTGSVEYLKETLEGINRINSNQEVLTPIHADGDGHCLVHGISRALVGRELFWHALRTSLKAHFQEKLDIYKAMFHDFVDSKEWDQIIAESDPDFVPGPNEEMGLQNIHIFGLANVLHRPIVLLDSLKGLQSAGDYTGVFLPALVEPELCQGPDGSLNKPLCIAWSSSGRNHFIALVAVKGRPLPKLPRWMLTRVWGAPQNLINRYIEFDEDDMCTIGGDRSLQDKYIQRLASAMEEVFQQEYGVHPSVVADVHHYIYKRTGIVGLRQETIITATRRAIEDRQLYSCLLCNAVSQIMDACNVDLDSLKPGGEHYELAKDTYHELAEGRIYSFPGLQCHYDPVLDELVVDLSQTSASCTCCKGKELRLERADGSIVYHNGDKTATPAPDTKCSCGFKHYWDGKEFDNMPLMISVPLNWKNESFSEEVAWFQNESDTSMNSNAYDVASKLVQQYFPTDFGSETLVKQIVDVILEKTAKSTPEFKPPSLQDMQSMTSPPGSQSPSPSKRTAAQSSQSPDRSKETAQRGQSPTTSRVTSSKGSQSPGSSRATASSSSQSASSPSTKPKGSSPKRRTDDIEPWNSQQSSKIILSGRSTQSLHKEELTLSKTEKEIQRRVSENAPIHQRKSPSRIHSGALPSSTKDSTAKQEKLKTVSKGVPSKTAVSGTKIRLSTSDGRQLTLSLDNHTTYAQLQQKINQELQIPIFRQTIKYGFPPKELRTPTPEHENDPLPLHHGDRITVEIAQDISDFPSTSSGFSSGSQGGVGSIGGPLKGQDGWSKDSTMQEIKWTIARLQENAGDDLEIQLTSQTLIANLKKMTFWEHVRALPSLFDNGGLFYEIVSRDLGLKDGHHCMLPGLKEHRFCYNKDYDRLELCLEPLGHFPISPDVDKLVRLKDMSMDPTAAHEDHDEQRETVAKGSCGERFPGAGQAISREEEDEMEQSDFNSLVGAVGGVDPPGVVETEAEGRLGQGKVEQNDGRVQSDSGRPFTNQRDERDETRGDWHLGGGNEGFGKDSGKVAEGVCEEQEEPMDTREEPNSPLPQVSLVAMETEVPAGEQEVASASDEPSKVESETGEPDEKGAAEDEEQRYVTVKLGPGYTVIMKDQEEK
ncbi:deubiquitinating protein VCPIP1-like isoform X2 [Apostichopus japonicus]|uniref:deubiquitinating protein VCPIP1-like isoform X2 n=1 Tax=Stichopus japonicus TaxID=307972 RepID=UPI003AB2F83A